MSLSTQPRVYLWSHPRTACHLLEKMFSAQPNTSFANHFFTNCLFNLLDPLSQKPISEADPAVLSGQKEALAEGYKQLTEFLSNADKKGEKTWYHDHPIFVLDPRKFSKFLYGDDGSGMKDDWTVKYDQKDKDVFPDKNSTNITLLPDDLYLDSRARHIFVIRHPLSQIPSMYRAQTHLLKSKTDVKAMSLGGSWYWVRQLYEFLTITNKHDHVYIIDADNFVTTDKDGKAVVSPALKTIAKGVGYEPDAMIAQWSLLPEEVVKSLPDVVQMMTKDLLESDGVKPKKTLEMHEKNSKSGVDDEERAKWREEFGEDGAKTVEELIKGCWEDYEWLFERRVKN